MTYKLISLHVALVLKIDELNKERNRQFPGGSAQEGGQTVNKVDKSVKEVQYIQSVILVFSVCPVLQRNGSIKQTRIGLKYGVVKTHKYLKAENNFYHQVHALYYRNRTIEETTR